MKFGIRVRTTNDASGNARSMVLVYAPRGILTGRVIEHSTRDAEVVARSWWKFQPHMPDFTIHPTEYRSLQMRPVFEPQTSRRLPESQ